MLQRFLACRVSSPFAGRLHLELVEWMPQFLTGNAWLLCMSHAQLLSHCPKLLLSLVRSRNWVCPRCEKTNLECLPNPTPGGPSPETIIHGPPETNSEVEVTQVAKTQVIHTTVTDSSPPPSHRDHPGEPLLTTVPVVPQTTVVTRSPVADPRPPLLLDTAICVLLVLALALLFRRFT